ncbi:DNA polymerase III subunit delta [Altericista sp. CCNU0014]|uniref:DNA polymerase III subunit delta n=1 Tax=Altericista sp. CCNU0014 TaxID=3082949 RepID=UPI00384AE9D2
MPVYLFWGDDEFRLQKAVRALIERVLDPTWKSFNLDKVENGSSTESLVQGLNQAVTPPFGQGDRLVWLVDPPLSGQESSVFLTELERTLAVLPATSHLLFTYEGKPDGRSKIAKLLQQQGVVEEFALAPPWKTDLIRNAVRQSARQMKLPMTDAALDLLAEAVGNDTRQLYSELEKLKLYGTQSDGSVRTVDPAMVVALVGTTQQSSLELANWVRQGLPDKALGLVEDLLRHNEPPLRISATLIKQFRTWLWVKLMQASGERDERAIAKAAEIANPKRVYFLSQDVKALSCAQLQQTLVILMELEAALKQGQEAKGTLQTKVIELCRACQPPRSV